MPVGSERQVIPVASLGTPSFPSPLRYSTVPDDGVPDFVRDDALVRNCLELHGNRPCEKDFLFEKAGPRQRLYFDPACTRAAIVTCGGLCPGLNDVIRSVFLELRMNYGVSDIFGIRYGYQGLNPQVGLPPVKLTLEMVEDIHREAGTILGSSRGHQDPKVIVDFLAEQKINMLFCVGGDGTQRGSHAIYEEVHRRGLDIAIIGIPKTIDNDIPYCETSFGTVTAVAEALKVLECAHAESKGAPYGIGLVKLMGREAGFITASATVASQDVNFALVPELPFKLEGEKGLLPVLRRRMLDRHHAVIAVAEGAGQDLFDRRTVERDASGNIKFQDIGPFLKQRILEYFDEHGPKVNVKYIDPSYTIRSVPANCEDSMLCDQFARNAVHAAMAGKTDVLIGIVHSQFIHVPIQMVVSEKKRMSLEGRLWAAVLSTTGQPRRFE